jgi:hypothetical protein
MVPQRDSAALCEALGRIARDPALAARVRAAALARGAGIWDRSRNLDELSRIFDERIAAVETEQAA